MNRSVQILLTAACLLPLLSPAAKETMEERKQRIMRKYMRDRSTIGVSELEVPYERPEDAEVVESELYKQEIDLQRDNAGTSTPLPPPPPLRRRPSARDRNWLLSADPLLDDPMTAENQAEPARQSDWTSWGTERDDKSPFGAGQYDDLYGRKAESKSIFSQDRYGTRREDPYKQQGYKPFTFGRQQSGFQQQDGRAGEAGYPGGYGMYGTQREQNRNAGTLNYGRGTPRTPGLNPALGANPYAGGMLNPYQRDKAQDESKIRGYTPYKSPYETQRMQRQQGMQAAGQQQEYKRVDPYKQWKERNANQFDPTRNDAYVDELMPKTRR